jgi:hypothetical protein
MHADESLLDLGHMLDFDTCSKLKLYSIYFHMRKVIRNIRTMHIPFGQRSKMAFSYNACCLNEKIGA